jgi:ammonia channel protein AmtB
MENSHPTTCKKKISTFYLLIIFQGLTDQLLLLNASPLAAIGTALLWMGWYGFNAGSALQAGPVAAYAISSTTIGSCVGVIVMSFLSLLKHKHVHTIGNKTVILKLLKFVTELTWSLFSLQMC